MRGEGGRSAQRLVEAGQVAAAGRGRTGRAPRRRIAGEVEVALALLAGGFAPAVDILLIRCRRRLIFARGRLRRAIRRGVVALEERVLLELGLDEGGQFQI